MAEITLDPEVRELLLDLAKDERTTLFRVTPRQAEIGPLESVPSASAATAGWTPAEKHLLESYREEVAFTLRAAFRAKIAEDDYASSLFLTPHASACRGPKRALRTVPEQVGADAESLAKMRASSHFQDPLRQVLTNLASGADSIPASWAEISQVLLRLEGSEVHRLYKASQLVLDGHPGSALNQALAGVSGSLRRWPQPWTILGVCQTKNEQHAEALKAYQVARGLAPDNLHIAASCLVCAMLAGEESAAREASRRVEELASFSGPAGETLVLAYQRRARYETYTRPDIPLQILSRIEETLGPVSGPVAHAFH